MRRTPRIRELVRLVLLILVCPVLAHGEPTRIGVIADVGKIPTSHSYRFVWVGGELTASRRIGPYFTLGAAFDLQRYWNRDDECFGSRGELGDLVASAGVDWFDPTANWLHLVAAVNFGLAWQHTVPTYFPRPSFDQLGTALSLVGGFEFGTGANRVRLQVTVAWPSVGDRTKASEPMVTAGIGFVFGRR